MAALPGRRCHGSLAEMSPQLLSLLGPPGLAGSVRLCQGLATFWPEGTRGPLTGARVGGRVPLMWGPFGVGSQVLAAPLSSRVTVANLALLVAVAGLAQR